MATSRLLALVIAKDKASPTFLKVATAVKALGVAVAAVGAVQLGRVLVRGLGDAVNASKTFEQSMSRVSGLAGVTGVSLTKLKDQAKELGRTTVFSAGEAADAMGEFAKAGFNAAEITGAIGPALTLAAAGQLELAQASSITSKVMTSMGKTTEDLENVVDVLAKAATSANTTVEELGGGFKFVGATAKATGVAFEDLVAAMAALASAGIPVEQSASQLRNLFLEIKKNTEDNITTFGKFKLELFDADGAFVGMAEALRRFEVAGINSSNVAQLFEKRLSAMLLAAMSNREAIDELEGSLRNADGTAKELADTFLANLGGALTRLESATTGLKTELGEKFQDVLIVLIDEALNPLINNLTEIVKGSDAVRVGLLTMARDIAVAIEPLERFFRSEEGAKLLELALLSLRRTMGDTSDDTTELGVAARLLMDQLDRTGPAQGIGIFRNLAGAWDEGKAAAGALGDILRRLDPGLVVVTLSALEAADAVEELGEDTLITSGVIDRINEMLRETGDSGDDAAAGVKKVDQALDNLDDSLKLVVAKGPVLVDVFKRLREQELPEFAPIDFSGALDFDPEPMLQLQRDAMAALNELRLGSETEWSALRMEIEIERLAEIFDLVIEQTKLRGESVVALEEEKERRITAVQARFSDARTKIFIDEFKTRLQLFTSLAQQMGTRTLATFRLNQAAAIANAIVFTAEGVARAFKDFTYPFNIVVGALVAAAGAVQIANIASANPGFQQGGIVPGLTLGRDTVPVLLDGGERVFSVSDNRDLIAAINQPTPVVVNVAVEGDGIRSLINDISVEVTRGGINLNATKIVSARSTR